MADTVYGYRLTKNYTAILRDLEPDKILPYLFQEEIFDEDDRDEVKAEKTRKKKAIVFLEKLPRCGPGAMEVFVGALRVKQPHLARILENPVPGENRVCARLELNKGVSNISTNLEGFHLEGAPPGKVNSPVEHNNLSKALPKRLGSTEKGSAYTFSSEDQDWVNPTDPRLEEFHDPDSVYPMKCVPHGFAILININKFDDSELEEREGSRRDQEDLELLFQKLGYIVKSPTLHTKEGILEELHGIVDDVKCSKVPHDSVVIFLMSHGENDFIFCSDGEKLPIVDVRNLFSNNNCDALAGKPKLIFVQACRGKERDRGLIRPDGPGETTDEPWRGREEIKEEKGKLHFDAAKGTLPSSSDVLVAFSSVSGYASFRNTAGGSRFVRKLVEVFREKAGSEDVLSMLTMVNNEVSKMGDFGTKQVPEPVTTLRKKVYFWPGLNSAQLE